MPYTFRSSLEQKKRVENPHTHVVPHGHAEGAEVRRLSHWGRGGTSSPRGGRGWASTPPAEDVGRLDVDAGGLDVDVVLAQGLGVAACGRRRRGDFHLQLRTLCLTVTAVYIKGQREGGFNQMREVVPPSCLTPHHKGNNKTVTSRIYWCWYSQERC